jgi:hypothetical protein
MEEYQFSKKKVSDSKGNYRIVLGRDTIEGFPEDPTVKFLRIANHIFKDKSLFK